MCEVTTVCAILREVRHTLYIYIYIADIDYIADITAVYPILREMRYSLYI